MAVPPAPPILATAGATTLYSCQRTREQASEKPAIARWHCTAVPVGKALRAYHCNRPDHNRVHASEGPAHWARALRLTARAREAAKFETPWCIDRACANDGPNNSL